MRSPTTRPAAGPHLPAGRHRPARPEPGRQVPSNRAPAGIAWPGEALQASAGGLGLRRPRRQARSGLADPRQVSPRQVTPAGARATSAARLGTPTGRDVSLADVSGRPAAGVRGQSRRALHDRHRREVNRRFMPGYTAQVGHWAEFLRDEVAARLPADIDRDRILAAARRAGTEIETLTGQGFGPPTRNTVSIATCGLPFVELPGLLIGSEESPVGIWPIPNPVDRREGHRGSSDGSAAAARARDARRARLAGSRQPVHAHCPVRLLSRDYIIQWLGHTFNPEERTEFLRSLLEPSNHVHVPVAFGAGGGWCFKFPRRLLWVTKATEEQRLLEPLFPDGDDGLRALVAVEPLLIVGRITSHPADWAMAVRIWPSVERPVAMASRWRQSRGRSATTASRPAS